MSLPILLALLVAAGTIVGSFIFSPWRQKKYRVGVITFIVLVLAACVATIAIEVTKRGPQPRIELSTDQEFPELSCSPGRDTTEYLTWYENTGSADAINLVDKLIILEGVETGNPKILWEGGPSMFESDVVKPGKNHRYKNYYTTFLKLQGYHSFGRTYFFNRVAYDDPEGKPVEPYRSIYLLSGNRMSIPDTDMRNIVKRVLKDLKQW